MNKTIGFLVVLMLATIVVACGPTLEPVTTIETVEVEKTVVETVEVEKEVPARTLVFSSRLFSLPREQEFFINEVIKPFEEEHNVTVNFQILDDDKLLERAKIQQSTGKILTDIVAAHSGRMGEWIDAGYVEDLTDIVASWADRNFSTTFESSTHRDGRQYFLPVSADVYLTIANNKALQYLPDGVSLDTLTWEQYAEWAVAVAEGEGEGKACITGIPMRMWIYMFGSSALSYGGGFPDANSEGAAKAWKVWETIGKADGFVPTVLNIDSCVSPLMREEAWLSVTHNARAGQVYASNETQFSIAPAPSGPAGIGAIAATNGYAIMKGTPNFDAAVQFLEYLTRPEMQVKIVKGTGGFIPPVQEALDYLGDEPVDEVIAKAILVLDNGIASGVPSSLYQDWGSVKQCFDDVFEDTILPGKDVDQARLDEAQQCVDDLLK